MKHWRDKSGELKKYVDYWMKKDRAFKPLVDCGMGILLVWRDDHETDHENMTVAAKTSKLSNKNRDIYGFDFMITVAKDVWDICSKAQRKLIIWHELYHCRIEFDEDGAAVVDNEERIKIWLLPHDVVVRTFSQQVSQFGLSPVEIEPAEQLAKAYRKHMKENR